MATLVLQPAPTSAKNILCSIQRHHRATTRRTTTKFYNSVRISNSYKFDAIQIRFQFEADSDPLSLWCGSVSVISFRVRIRLFSFHLNAYPDPPFYASTKWCESATLSYKPSRAPLWASKAPVLASAVPVFHLDANPVYHLVRMRVPIFTLNRIPPFFTFTRIRLPKMMRVRAKPGSTTLLSATTQCHHLVPPPDLTLWYDTRYQPHAHRPMPHSMPK